MSVFGVLIPSLKINENRKLKKKKMKQGFGWKGIFR